MAKYLNEDGVGLMLQNINDHINTKLSNYLPKTTPIPTKTSELTNDSSFVTSADTIAAANTVKTMKYGTCSTAAGTQVKGVTASGFKVEVGAQIRIKFSYVNTHANPKLSVNGGTAYPIYYNGSAITSSNFTFDVDKIYVFTFTSINSTNCWVLEGDWDSITSTTVSGWGFTKNAGTITGITMNGASKGTSGVVNLGTVVTDVSNKQDTLVSGTNIKTINGTSVLGSGDISIPEEVELIEISGDMLADEPTYTAAEAQAIIDAYNANKLIVIKCNRTRIRFGKGWFIPNISISTQAGSPQIQISLSCILGNYYTAHRIVFDTSAGAVSTSVHSLIDLSGIGGSSGGGPSMYAYGTCSTAAGTDTKTVTLTDSNFTVTTGSIVAVKFTDTNSVATTSLKLSVAGVTAQIKYLNTTFPSFQHWRAGSIVEFVYDGSAWQVLGTIKDNAGTDTKVNQTFTTTNSTYPLLFSATANKSTTSADAARFSTALKYNPSTDTLTVGNISSNITGVTDGGANLLGTCSSAANSSEKTINIVNVNLTSGSRVWIYFSNGNSYLGDMTCTINHKGTQITGAKIYVNNACGAYVTSAPAQYSSYNSGIVFSSGHYEFIVGINNNACYLRMTNNYIADSSPELHIKTGSTISHSVLIPLTPNVHTVFDNPGITTLAANTVLLPNKSYSFEFTSGSVAPTVSLPSNIKWANGTCPIFEANTTYHISIVNYCAVCASFKIAEPS